jgi:hypothetical protein
VPLNAPAARGSWRLDFYSQGLEIAGPLAEFINRQLHVALVVLFAEARGREGPPS